MEQVRTIDIDKVKRKPLLYVIHQLAGGIIGKEMKIGKPVSYRRNLSLPTRERFQIDAESTARPVIAWLIERLAGVSKRIQEDIYMSPEEMERNKKAFEIIKKGKIERAYAGPKRPRGMSREEMVRLTDELRKDTRLEDIAEEWSLEDHTRASHYLLGLSRIVGGYKRRNIGFSHIVTVPVQLDSEHIGLVSTHLSFRSEGKKVTMKMLATDVGRALVSSEGKLFVSEGMPSGQRSDNYKDALKTLVSLGRVAVGDGVVEVTEETHRPSLEISINFERHDISIEGDAAIIRALAGDKEEFDDTNSMLWGRKRRDILKVTLKGKTGKYFGLEGHEVKRPGYILRRLFELWGLLEAKEPDLYLFRKVKRLIQS
jgi:hypothetical protein